MAKGTLRPDWETPPFFGKWTTTLTAPDGFRVVGVEAFGAESGVPLWDVVFGYAPYSLYLEFHYFLHSSGAVVRRHSQYDGFSKKPWIAVRADDTPLSASPRTTRRGNRIGTHINRQLRWWKTPEAAMRAVEQDASRRSPEQPPEGQP